MGSKSKPKKKRDRFYKRLATRKGGWKNMPKRWITFPEPYLLVDSKGEPLTNSEGKVDDKLDFGAFLEKVWFNPLWNEGYDQSEAQDAIKRAYAEASKKGAPGMWLAESDWRYLETACKQPKQQLFTPMGPVTQPGFGMHPSVANQLLPMQRAVVKAVTEAEKERADLDAKKATA